MLFLSFNIAIVISFITSILISVTGTATRAASLLQLTCTQRAAAKTAKAFAAAEFQRSSLVRRPHQLLQHHNDTTADAPKSHVPESPASHHRAITAQLGPSEPPAEAVAASHCYVCRRRSCRTVCQNCHQPSPSQRITVRATSAAASGTHYICHISRQGQQQHPATADNGVARVWSRLSHY